MQHLEFNLSKNFYSVVINNEYMGRECVDSPAGLTENRHQSLLH